MILFNFFKGQKLKTGACKVDVPESCSSQHLNVPSLKKSKLPYKDILMNDDRYKNKQSTILTIKGEPHEATCRHCKHTITPGTLCFRIEGTICVEYKTRNVVEKSLSMLVIVSHLHSQFGRMLENQHVLKFRPM